MNLVQFWYSSFGLIKHIIAKTIKLGLKYVVCVPTQIEIRIRIHPNFAEEIIYEIFTARRFASNPRQPNTKLNELSKISPEKP